VLPRSFECVMAHPGTSGSAVSRSLHLLDQLLELLLGSRVPRVGQGVGAAFCLATLQHETAALRLVGKTVNAANRESGPLQDLLQGGYSYLGLHRTCV